MKFIQKYLVFWFFVYWIGYASFYFIFRTTSGRDPELLNGILLGLFMAILFTGAIYGALYFSIVPRMRYIESEDIKAPYYSDRQERIISPVNDYFSFAELREQIALKWIVTYEDDELHIIKFRTKDTFFYWGIGSYLAYDTAFKYVTVTSFPFTGYTQKGRRLKNELNNQIEDLILNA